jgi:hypothetical protein
MAAAEWKLVFPGLIIYIGFLVRRSRVETLDTKLRCTEILDPLSFPIDAEPRKGSKKIRITGTPAQWERSMQQNHLNAYRVAGKEDSVHVFQPIAENQAHFYKLAGAFIVSLHTRSPWWAG